ncbi:TetR/AcrR family transcriptional regulator [Alteromonas ponticola]|uniref:TetR/AcrR family transcriptional regulator n=1 Tax=Alteromonas ponticola TaxID=2720613 RepID=A0ABX1R6Q7_9ALTE|nr:TetR/AcrR family transcriptional regulator [Alteromonas ponticola]NMH61176.1 TetR/AcrR family transcriptional regulator [Alteromonas ponticola]
MNDKYFEHISIAELAEGAGVSVGTFYRRFKDKNALIPLLYEDFGKELDAWVTELEVHNLVDKEKVFEFLIHETVQFIRKRSGVFRTLHLYARLYPGLVPENKMTARKKEFERIARWIEKQLFNGSASGQQAAKTNMWVFIAVDTLIEKTLYNNVTPALACNMEINEFALHLSQNLYNDYKETL